MAFTMKVAVLTEKSCILCVCISVIRTHRRICNFFLWLLAELVQPINCFSPACRSSYGDPEVGNQLKILKTGDIDNLMSIVATTNMGGMGQMAFMMKSGIFVRKSRIFWVCVSSICTYRRICNFFFVASGRGGPTNNGSCRACSSSYGDPESGNQRNVREHGNFDNPMSIVATANM